MEKRRCFQGLKLVLIWLLVGVALPMAARSRQLPVDTLMQHLYQLAPDYNRIVRYYESDMYVKGQVRPIRTNGLIRSVPQTMRFAKGVKQYVFESFSKMNYTAPMVFDRKVLAVNGTFPSLKKEADQLFQFFNVQIYDEAIVGNHLLSPFMKQNRRFYKFHLDSIAHDQAFITYKRRYSNDQLMSGHFVMNMRTYAIEEVEFNGYYEFMKFKLNITYGMSGYQAVLPVRYDLIYRFNYVGNRVEGTYMALQHYTTVDINNRKVPRRKHHHDLTERYRLQIDTAKLHVDSALIAENRFVPLDSTETKIYADWSKWLEAKKLGDTITAVKWSAKKFFRKFGEAFVADYGLRTSDNNGRLKVTPILLNPMLFNYSKSRGYAYRADMRYTYNYPNGKYLQIAPRLGYNFTFREFNGRINTQFLYHPRRMSTIFFNIGSGRRLYSDVVTKKVLAAMPDTTGVSFENLNVFTDYYMELKHKHEILNGMDLSFGFNWHRKSLFYRPEIDLDALHIRDNYATFAFNLRVDYTPGQYYYWNRNRKEDVYSPFPTFSVDWEHGFPKILGSHGKYNRYEVEMNYSYKTNVLNRISYNVGAGIYTHKSDADFVDFNNFRHSHIPEGWDDKIGGTFHALSGKWYNVGDKYIRGHITYESPLLAITRLTKAATSIQAERIYLGALMTPQHHPYLELGYGFATHVIDLGVFVSLSNWEKTNFGFRYSLILYRTKR